MTPQQPAVIAAIDRVISALAGLAEALEQDAAPAGQEADLAAAQASPANSYGSTKHGRYDAASAAEVAEGVDKCPSCGSPSRRDRWDAQDADGMLCEDDWHEPGLCPAQWGEPPETMLCSLPSGHDGNHATAEHIEWAGAWQTAEPGAKDAS